MLGNEGGVERCVYVLSLPQCKLCLITTLLLCSLDVLEASPSVEPPPPPPKTEPIFTPYTDDPEAGYEEEPGVMLQTQRQMMDGSSLCVNPSKHLCS